MPDQGSAGTGGDDRVRELEQTEAKFDALLQAAVDAIVLIDEQGVIETFNNAAERMFDYPADRVVGENVRILMPEPYAGQHDQYMRNYHQTGKAKIIGIGREVQAQKADGTVFPIELSVGEVHGNQGRKYVGIIRDITMRVEAQAEAAEARERLAHVTRLSTMGEMASGIAHEINQPLTAITTYAQACRRMLDKAADPDQVKQVLEKISSQAERAGEVIRRLRLFFKKRSSQRSQSDINELIRTSVDINHADTRVLDHPVVLELDENLPPVVVDEVQIQQVLINLLRNAIDAMEDRPGELVTITSRRYDEDYLELTVVDHGGGIDDDKAAQLFNPFFSTKSGGMGMGLPISRSIVNSHGGKIWYTPADGGSVFHLTLPVAPD